MTTTLFALLSRAGLHDARDLASYAANLLLCGLFAVALARTLGPADDAGH